MMEGGKDLKLLQMQAQDSAVRVSAPLLRVATCLWLASLVAGCGDSSKPATGSQPSAAHLPSCAHVSKAIPLPAGFPTQFPLPCGTAITSHRKGFYGAAVIHGVIPSSSFAGSLAFFMREVPRAGFKLSEADSEPPREGEAGYRGHGYVGRWKIHSIAGCSTALTLDASAAKA